jgi:DNA-binding CsgD family transcriptional regulator
MTENERKKIADCLESGMNITQTRQLMAMTSAEFTRAIAEMRRNGELPKRKSGKERIAEAVARGETNPYELAETYGYTVGTIRHYKSVNEKTGRPKRNYKHSPRTLAIYADLKEGNLTTAEIARKHGIKWQSVHKLRRKLEADGEL